MHIKSKHAGQGPKPCRPSPLYCPLWSSCSRVFMTSMGCSMQASTTPPMEPATALTVGLTCGAEQPERRGREERWGAWDRCFRVAPAGGSQPSAGLVQAGFWRGPNLTTPCCLSAHNQASQSRADRR